MTTNTYSKADFRALRDKLGLSCRDVADALGLSERTVKNWEKQSHPKNPPDDVWQWLKNQEITYYKAIEESVNLVKEAVQAADGVAPRVITLTYYRGQDDYNRYGRDPGSYHVVNTRTRAVALELERLGYSVHYQYPTDDNNIYTRATHND
ncbi:XRE family transcriptional regulator [Alloscardovia theropitheci]|uniref:XRE family transcriptional regulator n=1 Tax=Alloscardovia theropitheci TaxID=2496842 RepID=A0A4R0QNU0_9BIFI|nr:helix-turn-helix domain-containing protein [Alloscardovia theropitheci]TCD53863.1 XRE family transcriptional regulator [Alloscardovia theropitheci]